MPEPSFPMRTAALLTVLAAASACSSGGDGSSDTGEPVQDDPTVTDPEAPQIELAPPERGFQLETLGTVIEAGEDTEYCEVVQLPGTPDQTFYINRMEIRMTDFSHHLIVSSINTEMPVHEELEVGSIVPCIGAMEVVGVGASTMIGGSQRPYDDRRFHDGTGILLQGGQKLIFDYHYLNTSSEPIHTGHKMNFFEVDAEAIEHVAQTMAFVNLTIDTPPGGSESFLGECQFTSDVIVGGLVRHTHQWGRDFDVWFSGGERDGEHIWNSTDYEGDTEYIFDTPIAMGPDEGFRFQCDFENTTDESLVFGLKASDEMCILFGEYWDPALFEPEQRQFCVMREVDEDGIARRGEIDAALIEQFTGATPETGN